MRIFQLAIVFAGLLSACQEIEPESETVSSYDHRIAYVSEIARRVTLIDLDAGTYAYTIEGDDPQRRYEPSDIGGAQTLCSDEEFFCTKGELDIVVPKGEMPSEFNFEGIECQSIVDQSDYELFLISCETELKKTMFLYGKRGVERYQIFCDVCDHSLNFLDTPVGLFQPPA